MREKMIPCERVKVEDKVQNVAFEPVGSKLAVLVGETPRIALKIFGHVEGKLTELHSFEKVTANTLRWSPRGQFLVAAGLGSMQGASADASHPPLPRAGNDYLHLGTSDISDEAIWNLVNMIQPLQLALCVRMGLHLRNAVILFYLQVSSSFSTPTQTHRSAWASTSWHRPCSGILQAVMCARSSAA